ncbi:MAG: DUF3703 domain-containing protein [Rhodoferax sp.]|nr:DUF3703 domain-containing protein [Rhodoferax sp.]MDP3653382.1 DUF3703 domain-containing protein [Rhodoferax sp.]
MKSLQMQAFDKEIQRVRDALANRDDDCAYQHLERAHILGQRYVWPHTLTHFLFLLIGYRRRDYREILGQLARIPIGMLGSALNMAPTGNTGGANVSMFKKMPIPDDLQES